MRIKSNNPDKIQALEKAGLKFVERVPVEVESKELAAHYLRTKKEKLGHLFEFDDLQNCLRIEKLKFQLFSVL